jgi:putative oxidoreductase
MIGAMANSKTGNSTAANAAAWVLQILAAAMFLMAGGSKLAGAQAMVDMFGAIAVGQWFRYVTGTIEVVSALLLLMPSTAAIGAALLVCVMVGAIITHFTVLHSSPAIPVALLIICSIVFWLRRDRVWAVAT